MRIGSIGVSAVLFIELLGAIGAIKLMAFTGNTEHRDSQNQQGKTFHHATA